MNVHYCVGRKARIAEKGYDSNPHSRTTQAFHWWCAGWNDEDMRVDKMRYFVNDSNRLVRTDDTGTYKPTEHWREVSPIEWEAFRVETFHIKKSKRK